MLRQQLYRQSFARRISPRQKSSTAGWRAGMRWFPLLLKRQKMLIKTTYASITARDQKLSPMENTSHISAVTACLHMSTSNIPVSRISSPTQNWGEEWLGRPGIPGSATGVLHAFPITLSKSGHLSGSHLSLFSVNYRVQDVWHPQWLAPDWCHDCCDAFTSTAPNHQQKG